MGFRAWLQGYYLYNRGRNGKYHGSCDCRVVYGSGFPYLRVPSVRFSIFKGSKLGVYLFQEATKFVSKLMLHWAAKTINEKLAVWIFGFKEPVENVFKGVPTLRGPLVGVPHSQ